MTDSQWGVNNRLTVKENIQAATLAINKYFPAAVTLNNPTDPLTDAAVWSCSAGVCSLRSDNKQNGIEVLTRCGSSAVDPILKKTPFETVETMKAADNCMVCDAGQRPRVLVNFYQGGVVINTYRIPKNATTGRVSDGVVAMGLCFAAPPRTTASGQVYDQWVVTLVPMYFARPPKATDTSDDLKSILLSHRENIMIGPMEQLGTKMKVIE
jgi:hypothetical protein